MALQIEALTSAPARDWSSCGGARAKPSFEHVLEWHVKGGACPHYRIAHDGSLVFTGCLVGPSISPITGIGRCEHVYCCQYDDCDIYLAGRITPPFIDQLTGLYPAYTKSDAFQYTQCSVPGDGDITRVSCGDFYKVAKCPNGCKEILIRVSCSQRFCPICWPGWATKQSGRCAARHAGAQRAFKGSLGVPRHIVLSPPQDEAVEMCRSLDGLKRLRTWGERVIVKAGARGGCAVPHM